MNKNACAHGFSMSLACYLHVATDPSLFNVEFSSINLLVYDQSAFTQVDHVLGGCNQQSCS
jgi:hypothetical protein